MLAILFSLQDVTEHLQVATHQAGDVQMIHVYGNGVLFPDMHATLPTVGFTRSEITDR
jgi:hypothetical protein